MSTSMYTLEKSHLKSVILQIDNVKKITKKRLDNLPSMYREDPYQLADLMYRAERKLQLIEKSLDKPYFARIDFENELKFVEKCYISKVGISDSENKILTVDWRAPIASMYYDSNIGNASYISPSGVINGNLLIKRQFDIENGLILSIQDVDTVSNDDMLKPYLNASADNRLKNIVSTIQWEQNKIIRENINKNIIVQGVAGSGKTTVALHKVAYLVYNNIDFIKPDEYLVIGPNKFFVNYISGVLPDLDVENVMQSTIFEILTSIIPNNLNLISDEERLEKYLKNANILNVSKYKSSINFKNDCDQIINEYIKKIIPDKDLIYKGIPILARSVIEKIFTEDINDYETLNVRMEKFYSKFSKFIETKKERIIFNVSNYYMLNKNEIKKEDYQCAIKEIKNKCSNIIKSYFSKAKPNIIQLYIQILLELNIKEVSYLRKKNVEFEDLAPLMYIYYKFYGNSKFYKYKHVVIDEAQDLSVFNYYVLKQLLSRATFSIFGDLAQSIYEYRSINNWEEIIEIFEKIDIKYLEKSYRTTVQIMNEANKITSNIGLAKAVPVIRNGKNVLYYRSSDLLKSILEVLNKYLKENYKSIAIICKTEKESIQIYEYLKNNGIVLTLISDNESNYNAGVCVITSYLAKGLEFDGVIISNASSNVYLENNLLDMKLLYVAMTRALHELTIIYNNDLVKFIGDEYE